MPLIAPMLVAATTSLADPLGSSTLVSAVDWLQATVLGTLATTIAVVAVAVIGMMMLAGRLPVRRGLTVLVGCFILFGASSIAAGIQGIARGAGEATSLPPQSQPVSAPPLSTAPTPKMPPGYDPYAGAAVPPR